MNDFLKSAQQTVLERLSSPLIGGFCISWCIWNYKFLVILFSAAGVTQTFNLIESHSFPNWWRIVFVGGLGPLVTALIYIFLYPYPARFIYKFTLEQQRRSNEILEQTLDEKPILQEEARRLRAEMREQRQEHKDEVDRLMQEIDDLRRVSAQKSNKMEKKSPETVTRKSAIVLDELKFKLLNLMATHDPESRGLSGEIITKRLGGGTVESLDLFHRMIEEQLIELKFSRHAGGNVYHMTPIGRRKYLEQKDAAGDKIIADEIRVSNPKW